jgi:hypothetical protein
MRTVSTLIQRCNPGIPKKYLLVVAAMVWTFAGGMLMVRGFLILKSNFRLRLPEETGSIIAGIIFYKFMFSKISLKHIKRIQSIQLERPSVFSFFNRRSYILMTIMITAGIILRLSGIIPVDYLALFYIAMGTPLLISALRFYSYAFRDLRKQGVQPTSGDL